MEIRDGFIVGIYNYCDSWCDRCAFTSRCQVFADMRETEAKLDPNLEAVAKAPCLPERLDGVPSSLPEPLSGVPAKHPMDVPPPPPWLKELLDEMDAAACASHPDDAFVRRELRHVPERDAID